MVNHKFVIEIFFENIAISLLIGHSYCKKNGYFVSLIVNSYSCKITIYYSWMAIGELNGQSFVDNWKFVLNGDLTWCALLKIYDI